MKDGQRKFDPSTMFVSLIGDPDYFDFQFAQVARISDYLYGQTSASLRYCR